jgi:hypothetical protein
LRRSGNVYGGSNHHANLNGRIVGRPVITLDASSTKGPAYQPGPFFCAWERGHPRGVAGTSAPVVGRRPAPYRPRKGTVASHTAMFAIRRQCHLKGALGTDPGGPLESLIAEPGMLSCPSKQALDSTRQYLGRAQSGISDEKP